MALALLSTVESQDIGTNILYTDTTVFGSPNAARNEVLVDFVVQDMRTDPPTDITPSYDNTSVTEMLVPITHDGWYRFIHSLSIVGDGVVPSLSFTLEIQPTTSTYSNVYMYIGDTIYTFQWTFGTNTAIGGTTTITATNMKNTMNTLIVAAAAAGGVDVPVVVTSLANLITFTGVEKGDYYNTTETLKVIDKIVADGTYAINIFESQSGGVYLNEDGDNELYMTGGIGVNNADEKVVDYLVNERFCECLANATAKLTQRSCGCEDPKLWERIFCLKGQLIGVEDLVEQNDMNSADMAIERLGLECNRVNENCEC